MSQPLQDLSNTRVREQREIMESLAVTGECFLCSDTITRIAALYPDFATTPIHEGDYLFVKKNDFPYEGSVLHLLIVPKRHVTSVEDFLPEEFLELQDMIRWINITFNVQGASFFLRYGDTSFTGATLSHLHFHVVHGVEKSKSSGVIKPKLGYKE
jgi:diadenosine tetraphosphate (Ap4A) HIT family hydrolase